MSGQNPDPGDDDRELGLEFGDLNDDLESESYPIGKEALLEEYGDRKVGYSDGEESLRSLLEPLNIDEFESPSDVRSWVNNMVGDEAEGRKGYSDRGTGEQAEETDESF